MVNIGQTYRYSSECAFYILSQQTHLIIFLDFISPSLFIPPQNFVYFLMLPFLVHKIFTFYINVVLNCRCHAPGTKGLIRFPFLCSLLLALTVRNKTNLDYRVDSNHVDVSSKAVTASLVKV